jgi:hypothetical protein
MLGQSVDLLSQDQYSEEWDHFHPEVAAPFAFGHSIAAKVAGNYNWTMNLFQVALVRSPMSLV